MVFPTHIRVPVTLGGKLLIAELDTDYIDTTMTPETAARLFDVKGDGAFHHDFGVLSLGGLTLADPDIAVRPDLTGTKDPGNIVKTGGLIDRVDKLADPADLHIGMDVLKNFHLYVAFHDQKLYASKNDAAP